jgi:pumilio family protein 6
MRHTIVQAILYDYYQNATDIERIKTVNELLKEKLPAILASTQGLYVACACFTMLDAKDRKLVLKSLKENIKEMFTNKLAHLFLIHIVNNLDDTTLSKKKILTELLKCIDELINEKFYQNIYLGILTPKSK